MPENKITAKQKQYLESLVCQRVNKDKSNEQLAKLFTNDRNDHVARALENGLKADKQDKVAYYIVKDPADNEPLMFFSLRCGELHKPLSLEKLEKAVDNNKALVDAARGKEAPEWAKDIIEKRKVDGVLPLNKYLDILDKYVKSLNKRNDYIDDKMRDGGNIIRTKNNYAGVELVHFCVHEPAKQKWENMGMGAQSMGKTLFWQFAFPVIQDIRKLVGVEFIYLFAADERMNRDGTLIQYYRTLGFDIREDLYVTKPPYDFSCYFMCQEVKALRNQQRKFFNNYNAAKEPAAV